MKYIIFLMLLVSSCVGNIDGTYYTCKVYQGGVIIAEECGCLRGESSSVYRIRTTTKCVRE